MTQRVHIPEPPIVTTDVWGARKAKAPAVMVGRPHEIVFHHTAGHHPEIRLPQDESRAELYAYAKAIQQFHMAPKPRGNDWNDSGHNFLIGRNGIICVGRHLSLPACRSGGMVVSAHCPGHNDQPGIEHEHDGVELMTVAQLHASIWLHAWLIQQGRMGDPHTVIKPHGALFPTSCPGHLVAELTLVRQRVDQLLRGYVRVDEL